MLALLPPGWGERSALIEEDMDNIKYFNGFKPMTDEEVLDGIMIQYNIFVNTVLSPTATRDIRNGHRKIIDLMEKELKYKAGSWITPEIEIILIKDDLLNMMERS